MSLLGWPLTLTIWQNLQMTLSRGFCGILMVHFHIEVVLPSVKSSLECSFPFPLRFNLTGVRTGGAKELVTQSTSWRKTKNPVSPSHSQPPLQITSRQQLRKRCNYNLEWSWKFGLLLWIKHTNSWSEDFNYLKVSIKVMVKRLINSTEERISGRQK